MRIGFDGKRAVQSLTGLGNYSRYLVQTLATFARENEYWLYAPKCYENKQLASLIERSKGTVSLHYPSDEEGKKHPSRWRTWGIGKELERDGIELYHGLSNELPLTIHEAKGVKSIVTVHDLIFRRHPFYYSLIDCLIYDYKCRYACRHADHIIAVSNCTKRDIMHYYGIPSEKISVIYQDSDPQFSTRVPEAKRDEVRQRYGLPESYVLSVGTIEKRKNTLLAVKALRRLPKKTHLVLVGKPTSYVRRLKAYIALHGLQKRVHLLHDVPFADLPAIYQCAMTFVYPSKYEGFSIPIVEALHSGVPVVAATGSSLEEAGGKGSIYVKPRDAKGLAEAIIRTQDPFVNANMISKGLKWVSRFSQKRMARELLYCYQKVTAKDE